MSIKAVLFDLWGTLVTGGASKETLLEADKRAWSYLSKKGYAISLEEYQRRKADCFLKYEDLVHNSNVHLTPELAFKKFMFYDANISEEDLKKVIEIHEIYDFYWDLRDDCETVLKELKSRGYKIALVTNSWLRQSKYILKKAGIFKYFDDILISCDLGFGKPNKKIFELMANKLRVKLTECVYVGDRMYADMYGSQQAGLAGVFIIGPAAKEILKKKSNGMTQVVAIKSLKETLTFMSNFEEK